MSGIQALAETNSNERGETPGKKRKKDETRSPVIVQPLSSSVPETSANDYPNYYTVSIKKTNGQPFSKDRIMQIRKATFLITKVNFELVFKQDESIDIYFTSSQAADHVLSKSKEIILDGSKILATKKDVEKLHKYVLYVVDTSVKVEEIQTELIDSSGLLINPSTAIRLSLNKEGFLHPNRSILISCKVELSREIFLYSMSLFYKIYKPKPLQCSTCLAHGHSKKHCKQSHPSCLKCGKTGHAISECPESDPFCRNCNRKGHTALQKQSCLAHQKRVVILRTSDKMNLPYSVVAARIPWQPTPHRPSRSQATVAVEDAKTVSFPKEANNVHTQGSSQSPHPLPKFTSTSCPPKDSSKSSQEWQRLATYLTVSHLIEVSNEAEETKNILKKKAITKLLGDDILQTAIAQLSSMKKDIDSTSKLVKPVDSTANQINTGSDNTATTPKTVVGATALVKGKKSKKNGKLSIPVQNYHQ